MKELYIDTLLRSKNKKNYVRIISDLCDTVPAWHNAVFESDYSFNNKYLDNDCLYTYFHYTPSSMIYKHFKYIEKYSRNITFPFKVLAKTMVKNNIVKSGYILIETKRVKLKSINTYWYYISAYEAEYNNGNYKKKKGGKRIPTSTLYTNNIEEAIENHNNLIMSMLFDNNTKFLI